MICGGGVAAIEALLGLRALLGVAPHVDLIAPNRRFVYQPLAVAEPFGLAQTRLFELAAVAAEHGAQLHVASLEAVDPDKRRIALSRVSHAALRHPDCRGRGAAVRVAPRRAAVHRSC